MQPVLKYIKIENENAKQVDVDLLEKAFVFTKTNGIDISAIQDINELHSLLSSQSINSWIFVIFPFNGPVFELLKMKECRIVGPQCILSCFLMEVPIPKQPYPICNLAMTGVVVCCSSMKKEERLELQRLILLMGGEFSPSFTTDVTHLIAKEVGSKKYQVACEQNIPVLLPKWVHETWEKSMYDHVLVNDSRNYADYLVPIFKGCTICVTGLDLKSRENIQVLVTENGGTYSGELNMKTCTHLLCEYPKGQKYKFAKEWKLHCVYPKWFHDCLKYKHWVDESSYYVQSTESLDSLPPISKDGSNVVDESKVVMNATKSRESSIAHFSNNNNFINFDSRKVSLNNFTLPNNSNGSYLDGCKVFLNDKPSPLFDCCRKIVNEGGGVRFSHLSESLTHIVAWDIITNDIKLFYMNVDGSKPFLVSPIWLIDSCCSQTLKPEKDYLLYRENKTKEPVRKSIIPKPPNTTSINLDFEDNQEDDVTLTNQYMLGKHESTRLSQVAIEKEKKAESCYIGDETTTFEAPPVQVFSGKTFVLCDFDEESTADLEGEIEQYGGRVIEDNQKCDYVLVPLSYNEKERAVSEKEVTICWFEECWEKEQLLSLNASYLFKPIYIPLDVKPLSGCYVSISQYNGVERTHLFHLVTLLGGRGQEVFARMKGNGVNASTHLILKHPEGPKYEAAVKWGIPTVSRKWLFHCCRDQKLLPENEFPVTYEEDASFYNFPEARNNLLNNSVKTVKSMDETDPIKEPEKENEVVHDLTENQVLDIEQPSDANISEIQHDTTIAKNLPQIKTGMKLDRSRFSFDFTDTLTGINSPAAYSQDSISKKTKRNRPSVPFDLQFTEALEKAVEKHVPQECRSQPDESGHCREEIKDASNNCINVSQPRKTILKDACVVISKKLSRRQKELHNLVTLLGGSVQFLYSDNCTHFVHEGRINDTTKDYIQAKNAQKHLVSPHWLEACSEANKLIPESKYPINYNPRMSIDVSSLSKESPKVTKVMSCDEKLNADMKVEPLAKPSVSQDNSDYQKKMEKIMKTNKTAKTRKSSRKLTHTPSEVEQCSSEETTQQSLPNKSKVIDSMNSVDDSKKQQNNIVIHQEQSQNDCITYDDPMGRLEREKILAQLKQASPSQDVEYALSISKARSLQDTAVIKKHNKDLNEAEECIIEEVEEVEEVVKSNLSDNCEQNAGIESAGEKYKFLMSGLNSQEKVNYAAVIEKLGGIVFDVQYFNSSCTHLIVNAPSRNEKYLAAVASGKWALHKSFISASQENGAFVNEADHEWGNHDKENDLAAAARRWRIEIARRKHNKEPPGAFTGWVVLLCISGNKHAGFKRILEAGDAKILDIRPPFSKTEGATHAIIEDKELAKSMNVDFKELHDMGILVIKPEYVSDFLSSTVALKVNDYLIDELRMISNREKRKASSSISSTRQKRSRR